MRQNIVLTFLIYVAAVGVASALHTVPGSRNVHPSRRRSLSRPRRGTAAIPRVTDKDSLPDFLQIPRGGDVALGSASTAVALAETLAPSVGILTSTALYFAPLPAVWAAVRSNDIGDLNPLPLAIMSTVSVAWLAYGLSTRDKYVIMSNVFGAIGSIGYVIGILPLLSEKKSQLRNTQVVALAGVACTLLLWTILGLTGASAARISASLGLFASSFFIILSGSPLSTIKTVITSKNSASILGTLTVAQVTNTALWSAYGLAIKDTFVWGPNVAGLGLGLIQLVLKIMFPAKKTKA